jgi:SPP1 gp7 family putative phage head morphogenesis protein
MAIIINCGNCKKQTEAEQIVEYARYKCKSCDAINEVLDVRLKEWLGFNYNKYLLDIIKTIKADNFENLKADNLEELNNGYLSAEQITKVKALFTKVFKNGQTIRDLVNGLKKEVGLTDLKYIDANEIERTLALNQRSLMIARTESTRLANLGSINYYKANGYDNYTWIAGNDDRTCEECWALNGVVMNVNSGEKPPLHILCRCSTAAVTELDDRIE